MGRWWGIINTIRSLRPLSHYFINPFVNFPIFQLKYSVLRSSTARHSIARQRTLEIKNPMESTLFRGLDDVLFHVRGEQVMACVGIRLRAAGKMRGRKGNYARKEREGKFMRGSLTNARKKFRKIT